MAIVAILANTAFILALAGNKWEWSKQKPGFPASKLEKKTLPKTKQLK
jgi:hypothetical protein